MRKKKGHYIFMKFSRSKLGLAVVLLATVISTGAYIYYAISTQASSKVASIVSIANNKVGSVYVWGAEGPRVFDCSGLAYYAYKKSGVSLGGRLTALAYSRKGTAVGKSNLKAGDLIFFDGNGDGVIDHIAISKGGTKFVQASKSFGKVVVSSFSTKIPGKDKTYGDIYVKSRRVVGAKDESATTNSHPTIKVGSKGSSVSEFQRDLNALAYGPLTVDGSFGPATEKAVKKFQRDQGLKADGIVGPATWSKMEQTLSKLQVA